MENLETPQKRLEYFIKQVFKTKTKFADMMGMIASDVSKYTGKGESIFQTVDKHKKLSELGLNIDWYRFGTGQMLNTQNIVSEPIAVYNIDIPDIEITSIPAHANIGTFVDFNDLPVYSQNLGKLFTSDTRKLKGIRVTGNSMIEANINDGDLIIYETGKTPKNNDLIVCILNGVLFVKRYKVNEHIELHSAYNGTPPIIVNEIDDKFDIIGIVKYKFNIMM